MAFPSPFIHMNQMAAPFNILLFGAMINPLQVLVDAKTDLPKTDAIMVRTERSVR